MLPNELGTQSASRSGDLTGPIPIKVPIDEAFGPTPDDSNTDIDSEILTDNYFRDGLIFAKAKDYLEGINGKEKNYNKAIPLLLTLSEGGSTSAQFELAKLYRFGNGVKQDINLAVSYYRKAANHGNGDAQCSLGALYYKGTGVQKSYFMAILYFKKAAAQGDRTGQFNLACSYLDGTGVDKDKTKAVDWFKLSAAQGYEPAIKILKTLTN